MNKINLKNKHKFLLSFFLIFLSIQKTIFSAHIGLCIMATGKYLNLAHELIVSARNHFCPNHQVTFFVFTDGKISATPNIKKIFQQRLGWPYDTLMRFAVYARHKEILNQMDYLYAVDADMLFVNSVEDEILSNRVAVLHPGYVGTIGTPETNPISQAFIPSNARKSYFAGGFYGGTREVFFRIIETCAEQIQQDFKEKYIAIWHDESHLNKYFTDHPPTTILPMTYCFPERHYSRARVDVKLLALEKNHHELRKR